MLCSRTYPRNFVESYNEVLHISFIRSHVTKLTYSIGTKCHQASFPLLCLLDSDLSTRWSNVSLRTFQEIGEKCVMFIPKLVFFSCNLHLRDSSGTNFYLKYYFKETFWIGVIQNVDNIIRASNDRQPLPQERAL